MANELSLSFAGCGFLSFYYVGVNACLKQYKQINDKTITCGASSGIVAGLDICLDLSIDKSINQLLDVAIKLREKPLGLIHPSVDLHKILYDSLMEVLPDDCHRRFSGRLYISVTRVSDGQNVLISQFDSKEDLIRAIQCSSFIPFLSGMSPPKYKGIAYIDGALSNNSPKVTNNTITVSPWSGEFDICPISDSSLPLQVMFYNKLISLSPMNLYRMTQIAFPPSWSDKHTLCQQGFDDTLRFLLRNDMISCTRCLSGEQLFSSLKSISEDSEDEDRQSSDSGYGKTPTKDEYLPYHSTSKCAECHNKMELTVEDSLPNAVFQAIAEAEHKINQKIINKLCRHPPIKLLFILFIPFLLLFELIVAIIIGIFTNNWSSDVFKDMLNISKIMILNGITGRDHKSTVD